MLFADAEGFWKTPNVYDALSVVGFVVGVGSIWFSWWLAKRDISKKVNEAKLASEQAIRRVAETLLHLDLAEVALSVKMAKEACDARRWPRAKEKLVDCRALLNRVVVQERVQVVMRQDIVACISALASLEIEIDKVSRGSRTGTGSMPSEVQQRLDDLYSIVQRIDGRFRNTLWETEREL